MSTNPIERAALSYADHGWRVLPVIQKRPHPSLAPHGYRSASCDPDRIKTWWRAEPEANVGLACRPSEVLAIDVDPRNGGDDALHTLENELGTLPTTPRSLTGGGGVHLLFTNPHVQAVRELADGVDVRDTAMIVLPPSRHSSGRSYAWEVWPEEAPLATFPGPWRTLLERTKEKRARVSCRDEGPILQGTRNQTLTRIAGALRRATLNPEAIEAALLVVNRSRCEPPLPEVEVRRISQSIGRRSTAPPWALNPIKFADDPSLNSIERHALSALCMHADDQGVVIGGPWLLRETALSPRSVVRAIKGLEQSNRIWVSRKRGRPNLYTLLG